MSFQGDVAGIGLGELLQGLARGGKDGVLTLYGDKLAGALGLKGGLLYLLESPEEDPEEWRRRAEHAWMHQPDADYDQVRREAIARAARMETVYSLLEADNLHFRFEPGLLPAPSRRPMPRMDASEFSIDGELAEDEPHGPGMAVEFVLLEHARIQDEGGSGETKPALFDVPRFVEGAQRSSSYLQLIEQCDECSTVQELADRLGWPTRQARGAVGELVAEGCLRLAEPRELLELARVELESQRFERAATLVSGWLDQAAPGPPLVGEADVVFDLWQTGLLAPLFAQLERSQARVLARKLDSIDVDLQSQVDRWAVLAELPSAPTSHALHYAALRTRLPREERAGLEQELLRIARKFLNKGLTNRAQATLNLLAAINPGELSVRVEVGTKFLEAGALETGADWLVEAAQELIAEREYDRAIQVLHSLLQSVPNHRAANGMLLETRARIKRKGRRRMHIAIATGIFLVASGAGVVRMQVSKDRERKLVEVTDLIEQPDRAMALLEQYFATDNSSRVMALRVAVNKRREEYHAALSEGWLDHYHAIEAQVTSGEALEAYEQAIALPAPPDVIPRYQQNWGTRDKLLTQLANRLEDRAQELDAPIDADQIALDAEAELIAVIEAVAARARAGVSDPTTEAFALRITDLEKLVVERRGIRSSERERLATRVAEQRQDELLSAARFHAQSGELDQAIEKYDELMALDGMESVADLLRDEIEVVIGQKTALDVAIDAALAGRHEEAISLLEEAKLDPRIFALPWRVDSEPKGALVRLSDGTERFTPFSMETTVGTTVRLEFVFKGTEGVRVEIDRPQDVKPFLYRETERRWVTDTSVEAIPVAIGNDQVIADRFGHVRRFDAQGEEVWAVDLPTLGGIARTPLFLPARPGHLLLLSEDGMAWTVDAETGAVEGPWTHDAPPVEGLVPLRSGVGALFDDGTVAIWEHGPEPRTEKGRSLLDQPGRFEEDEYAERYDHAVALHRGTGRLPELGNPWNSWRVEILDGHYLIRKGGRDPKQFTASREGRWMFVAWGEPNALAPDGRLWISDEGGLRSFTP